MYLEIGCLFYLQREKEYKTPVLHEICFANCAFIIVPFHAQSVFHIKKFFPLPHSNFSITAPPNFRVLLTFFNFSTESLDPVKIYDGTSPTNTLLVTYAGVSQSPAPVRSSGQNMFVTFTSDSSVVYDGFYAIATFESLCGVVFSAATTTIAFSGYPNNAYCLWYLNAAYGQRWTFTFNQFGTEAGVDFLTIYNYQDTSIPAYAIGSYSGSSLPSTLIASGSNVTVLFTSDAANNVFVGFNITATLGATPACSGTTTVTTNGYVISEGGGNYAANANCLWNITAPVNYIVSLSFLAFVTEATYDFVYVYNGTTTSSPQLLYTSGSVVPGVQRTFTQYMLVRFTSDSVGQYGGFSARVTFDSIFCSGLTLIAVAGTQISDGPFNYANNAFWQVFISLV